MHDTSAPLVTSGARRGWGYRQPGGPYLAVPLGPGGCLLREASWSISPALRAVADALSNEFGC